MNNKIIEAIKNKHLIRFSYDGGFRVVEPHCYGLTTKGNEGLRAFQTDGYSSSGEMGWKMFDLGKGESIEILDEVFKGSRSGYKRQDKGMSKIYIEI
ncbi:MAG: hypothetical protein SH819_06200 [Cytophagales bacterium]|nr:hypothetical protein [Cytophagales bacterium]